MKNHSFQVDALFLQAAEFTVLRVGLGKLFRRQAGDFEVGNLVGFNIPLGGVDGGFRYFGRQHLIEMLRKRQGEIAVAAVQLKHVFA